ncbi:DUF3822 family protein [Bacteroidales bacterium OttesenSCG-928-B11]|nr:DUF3822 family protein [Bacteroidales bacterium OttesenSCG-928-C03]MDL2311801.1 DUF3822 family protein [Bacteroidales bacterium OttesenSCG-928-B11]MDL2326194.1 DUF3822 family protein [Bacteroidales bacterium OttesenSCG-928-A14]
MNIFLYNQAKSIRIHSNGFSLFKKERGNKIVKQEYPNVIFGTLPDYAADFLKLSPGESIDIIANLSPPVLIPTDFFEEDSIEKYLRMQFPISKQDHFFHDVIEDYHAVYYLTDEVVNNLRRLKTPYKVIHQSTLLHGKLVSSADREKDTIILTINDSNFDIILLKNKKIQLINTFRHSSYHDILYYLLNTLKQFDIKLSDIGVQLIQNDHKGMLALLKEYFPNTKSISY